MANIGNKHKNPKVNEWGSKDRKYQDKKFRQTNKRRIRQEVEEEYEIKTSGKRKVRRVK